MSVNILQGDILSFYGDAIVNPANSFLNHSGGLARVIDTAARGGSFEDNYGRVCYRDPRGGDWVHQQEAAPLVPTGGVHVTGAGVLPYVGVIHAVGPIWGGGNHYEGELLILAHRNAILAAAERGWTRIAFPAISCGIFGFPVEQAAPLAVGVAAVGEANYGVECSFYLFEDAHYQAYVAAGRRGQA